MSTETKTEPDLQLIPTSKIAAVPGFNPRGEFSRDDDEFKSLKASIAERGIETPIKVGAPDSDGIHPIIFGHRRHAAAAELGRDLVPALVDGELDEKQRYIAAIVENRERADMSPAAEANALKVLREDLGLKQSEAAEVMAMSERKARDREKLLNLPEATRAAFDRGDLDLQAIPAIAAVAEQAPKLADYLAAVANGDPDDPSTRLNYARSEELVMGICDALDSKADLGCVVGAAGGIEFADLKRAGLPAAKLADFKKRFTKVEKAHPWYWRSVTVTDADLTAAKAAGCLLEVEGRRRRVVLLTDPDWIVQFLDERLDDELKEAKEKRERNRIPRDLGGGQAEQRDDSPEAKEKRRQEREDDYLDKLRRRRANIAVGERSLAEYTTPALLLEEAQLLALMALGGDAKQIADKGLIFCEEGLQEVTEQKNGKTKVTYGKGKEAGEETTTAILESKDPLEAIGIALRALVLTVAADDEVVAPSSRGYWSPTYREGTSRSVGRLLEEIVAKRGLDSTEIRRQLERQDRAAALEDEIGLLDQVAKCRAKAGLSVESIEAHLTDLLVAAVGKRQLKQHEDGREDEVTFTITAAGKKRLEKARAELKALGVKGERPVAPSTAKAATDTDRVFDVIKEFPGIPAADVAKKTELKPNRVYRILGDLEKAGRIKKSKGKFEAVAEEK
ncbi:MAG TPA: ParB/RepB/Spo0J family partition protein [Solirubrobacterales bacterium]|nr:ParB/RepB/Spo0J family partition protein [Solirubrobacterales bacterium]